MNFLDVRTVMFSHIITGLVCTMVLVFLWFQNRKHFAGIAYWILDFVFQTAGSILIVLRGSIPDWVSMGISNTLMIAGALFGYIGLSAFVGKKSPQAHNYVLLAIFVAVQTYFIFVNPNLEVRTANISIGFLIICFQCVWLLLHRVEPAMRRITQNVGFIFSAFCLVSIVRVVGILLIPASSNDFFQSSLYDTLILVSYQILLILLTFGMTLMVNKRLLEAVETQEEKFSKAFRSSPYAITLTRLSDGKILDVNNKFLTISGYSLKEVINKTTLDLKLWANEADREAVLRELSAGRQVTEKEFPFRMKSGEVLTGLFTADRITINNEPWVLASFVDITERKQMERQIRERMKELQAIYSLSEVVEKEDITPDELYKEILVFLSKSWQYPEACCTRIIMDDREYRSNNFAETDWMQSAPIKVYGKVVGKIEIGYLEQKPQEYEGPFLKEERRLINLIAARLGHITERRKAEEALYQSEVKLRGLFSSMTDVVIVYDRDGRYIDIAPTNPANFVRPREEMLGRYVHDILPKKQADFTIDKVRETIKTNEVVSGEYALQINGKETWFAFSTSRISEATAIWVAHDITQQKRSELVQNAISRITQTVITSADIQELYHSIHSLLGELVPADNFYIALYDPVSELISFPYSVDQYDDSPPVMTKDHGMTGYVIRTGRPILATREVFDRLMEQGEVDLVGTMGVDWLGVPLIVNGRIIGVLAVQSYTEDIHYDRYDLNVMEIVSTQVAQVIERKRLEEEIRILSLTDDLTRLWNRRGFNLLAKEEVKQANRKKRKMLIFYGDVDDLKGINDTYGHAQGDQALIDVSEILKSCFREGDILSRIGGDEFVALAVDAELENAETMTSRIRSSLEELSRKGKRPYQLCLSVGFAIYDPEAPCTVSELIARADEFMYRQKKVKKRK
jgi:diguanylate cyclase (GGDEF)-like protein/PAS domain S-box-containing protein